MTDQDASTDFYRLLRVSPAATLDEIRDAVRQQRRHFNNRVNNSPDHPGASRLC
jgi:DnaJ-class molecular chaperone